MYRKKPNSFLVETLLPDKDKIYKGGLYREYKRNIPSRYTNNLTTVSALYIYTGTPPHGYGTQAPKVAETVIRSYDYNKKKQNKEMNLGGTTIQRMQWEKSDGKFPHDEVHGNFIPSCVREMTEEFLLKYCTHIDNTVDDIIKRCLNTNSDVLTKGRQTFCPFTGQSLTAAQAYENAINKNMKIKIGFGVFEWIQAFVSMFDKDSISYQTTEEFISKKTKFNKATKQHVKIEKIKTRRVTKNTESNEETQKKNNEASCLQVCIIH